MLKLHRKSLLIISLAWLSLYPSVAQLNLWPYLKQLQLDFSEEDETRIGRIDQHRENAMELVESAFETDNPVYLKRAFDELFTGSRDLFDIYTRYSTNELGRLPGELQSEFDKPFRMARLAQDYLRKSDILRNLAEKATDIDSADIIFLMAFDLDQLALLNKGRSLRMLQDLPVVYYYPWDVDYTSMESTPLRVVTVLDTDLYNSDDAEESVQVSVNPERETVSANADAGSPDRHGQTMEVPETLIYIIQLAAHTSEIPGSSLSRIYSGSRQINLMIEDGWHKYYLGPFSTFEEADKVMKSLQMSNIFLAAYLNGRRIGIGEARKKQGELR
jgi:hypothetical protein